MLSRLATFVYIALTSLVVLALLALVAPATTRGRRQPDVATPAQIVATAHQHPRAHRARIHHRHRRRAVKRAPAPPPPTPAACPAGDPVQTITLVDQTGQNVVTTQIESALTDESVLLRDAWGTPCVQFGAGGWDIYLRSGAQQLPNGGSTYTVAGEHYGSGDPGSLYAGQPYAIVTVTTLGWTDPSARAVSHELDEMLEDPQDTTHWAYGLLEVCDPVEDQTYPVDGLPLTDFVLPSYFSQRPGPWDEAQALTGSSAGIG